MNRNIDEEEGIIRPLKREGDPDIGPDVMMVMIRHDLEYLLSMSPTYEIKRFHMGSFGLYQLTDGLDSALTLAGPFLGAPQAVLGMEKIIALGGKRIWAFGWCGSLVADLRIGDLLIPISGISEEGTSLHYPIGERNVTTDPELCEVIAEALRRKGQAFRRGPVWTTDAPYRETPSKVRKYQTQGVMAVEMEMYALMTLALYRKVRFAAVLVVSDELFELKWHPGFSNPRLKESLRLAGGLLIELVKSSSTDKGRRPQEISIPSARGYKVDGGDH